MFGLKKKEKQGDQPVDAHIETMPEIFYGGQDPLVYRTSPQPTKVEASRSTSSIPTPLKAPQKPPPISPSQPLPQPIAPSSPSFFHQKWVWISASVVLIFVIGGIIWYYIQQARPKKQSVRPGQISLSTRTAPLPTPPQPPPLPAPPPEEAVPTTTPARSGGAIDFPRLALVDSSDLDGDELTDVEEELFGTDTGMWDSDGDSYYDGQEVLNLYNPKGTAPIKLIDSGLIREYRNPTSGYHLYYPKAWQLDSVSEDNAQVIITGTTGDFIEIRAVPRESGDTFERWFAVNAPRQKITDLETVANRFGVSLKVRTDKLVAYIEDTAHILVVSYHPLDSGPITFRHIMQLIIQSIRPSTFSSSVLLPTTTSTP